MRRKELQNFLDKKATARDKQGMQEFLQLATRGDMRLSEN